MSAGLTASRIRAFGSVRIFGHDDVENRLSFQEQRMVEERGLETLGQLDFAALLRVLDQNWYELSQALNLPREGRTWVITV